MKRFFTVAWHGSRLRLAACVRIIPIDMFGRKMMPRRTSRAAAIIFGLTALSCDAITGSGRPSFYLALSADTLPVFEEASVVVVDAAGDTMQTRVHEWTTASAQVASVSAMPDRLDSDRYAPAAQVEARQVGSTTISAEIDGERATAKLVVVPPLLPEPPGVFATYFSRNHRVWVRWGPLNRSRFFRVYRKQVDQSEWTLIAEGLMADHNDFIGPGTDPSTLLYTAELCNESGCSRGEAVSPIF